jgi:peptidoglycan/LPS O-acetylase OafA/YrhL
LPRPSCTIHGPIVGVLSKYAINPLDVSQPVKFGLFVVLGLPIILVVCYGFHLLFEAPFLRIRELQGLRTLAVVQKLQRRRPAKAIAAVSHAEVAERV